MSFYYKRSDDFNNLSYDETINYFEKVVDCYLKQILTLSQHGPAAANLNPRNINRTIALSKMLNKNYEIYQPEIEHAEGLLLQSWVSLGAILEGCLQSFLKIYYEAYDTNPVHNLNGNKIKIENLRSYQLIEYFFNGDGIIQNGEFDKNNIDNIRIQRNLIHFFVDDIVDTWDILNQSVKLVIEILLDLISRLPDLQNEDGFIHLCDERLYMEVYNLKYKWFELIEL